VNGDDVELMRITVRNNSDAPQTITPTVAVPLFARALSNKHDHEHVTCLLHRTQQVEQGVLVTPTMRFNEEGHLANTEVYFVFGSEESGEPIKGSFPTVDRFCGVGGDYFVPDAVFNNIEPTALSDEELNGKEVAGGLRFKSIQLNSGESRSYVVMTGVSNNKERAEEIFKAYKSVEKIDEVLEENKSYWSDKTDSIVFRTGDTNVNAWMRWVVIQPILRRIFGCSFLPDHDYGKGGKGWRDIWQDLLSLILIEPEHVKDMLINNFAGN